MADKTKAAAPYIPFRTFLTALDYLKEHGVPNVIDKTVFPKIEPVLRGAVISALRFLNLVNEEGIPSQELMDLAINGDNRHQTMRSVLEKAYADLFAGNLAGMSPSQFDNLFTPDAYSVNGDTLTKARTFFLKAAEFAKVPISAHLTRRSRASSGRKKKTAGGKASGTPGNGQTPPANTPPVAGGETKTLTLPSGATLSLTLSVNFMSLPKAERDAVSGLIDKIDEYAGTGDNSPVKGVSE